MIDNIMILTKYIIRLQIKFAALFQIENHLAVKAKCVTENG